MSTDPSPSVNDATAYFYNTASSDPLAVLDTPKPKQAEEELPFTDEVDSEERIRGIRSGELTLDINWDKDALERYQRSLEDCIVADEKATEAIKQIAVVRCGHCHELYLANSERISDGHELVGASLNGDPITITLCDDCIEGIKRRSTKPSPTAPLSLPDLFGLKVAPMPNLYLSPNVWSTSDNANISVSDSSNASNTINTNPYLN